MSANIVLLILLAQLTCLTRSEEDPNLLVETTSGFVKGMSSTSYTGKKVRTFYGIPYAEPPVGNNRFRPPVPVKHWEGEFDATKTPLPCYQQYTKDGLKQASLLNTIVRRPWSEDCLTLNIWSPTLVTPETPGFILVHDGGFLTGTGGYPYYSMSTYAAEADIFMITFNYRLGAFGFLSLGNRDFPGNLGLMDQQLVLRWISDNIRRFGGKKEALFVVGFEAGASAIGFQIIIPENAGLFKTGVMVSGAPNCDWAWQSSETALSLAKTLSQNLGCNRTDSAEEIECLQRAHPEDVVDATIVTASKENFKPNIDGNFIKETPNESIKAGRFNNNTVFISNGLQDGVFKFFLSNDIQYSDSEAGLTVEDFKEAINVSSLAHTPSEVEAILEWYLKNDCTMNQTEIRDAAVNAYSDGLSTCCTNEFLRYAVRKGNIGYKVIYGVPDPRFPELLAYNHLGFQPIFFGETLNPRLNYSTAVKHTTMVLMKLAGVYMRKMAIEFQEVVPLYNEEDKRYLIWKEIPTPDRNFREDECVLWNEILPEFRRSSKDNGKCL